MLNDIVNITNIEKKLNVMGKVFYAIGLLVFVIAFAFVVFSFVADDLGEFGLIYGIITGCSSLGLVAQGYMMCGIAKILEKIK